MVNGESLLNCRNGKTLSEIKERVIKIEGKIDGFKEYKKEFDELDDTVQKLYTKVTVMDTDIHSNQIWEKIKSVVIATLFLMLGAMAQYIFFV